MIRSVAILQLLRAMEDLTGFSQVPGWRRSHALDSGRQVKKSLTKIATQKANTRTVTIYAAVRKALFGRKIVT